MIIDIGRVFLRLSVADGETVTDTSKKLTQTNWWWHNSCYCFGQVIVVVVWQPVMAILTAETPRE